MAVRDTKLRSYLSKNIYLFHDLSLFFLQVHYNKINFIHWIFFDL